MTTLADQIEGADGPCRELDPELIWLLQKLFDSGCKNAAFELYLMHRSPRPARYRGEE